jgi:D-3-phosphoglycerate dehydrogenase
MDLSNYKIVRTDCEIDCPAIDSSLTDSGAKLILTPAGISEFGLISAVKDADLLLMCYTPVTGNVIRSASKLRGIVKYGVGIDAIDLSTAIECGIPVVNVPEYAEQTVAEGAFCLLIALAKKLLPLDRAMKRSGWVSPTTPWLATDLAGKTLGLIGVGRIGRSMARMAGSGFNVRVIGYNPNMSAQKMQAAGVEKYNDLHAMLNVSDMVSIHCVLSPSTLGMIGTEEFAVMSRKPLLINVSRGAIVDEAAMLHALKTGQISGAGLDVFSAEPLNRTTHPLRSLFDMDNVILSPHLTFFTEEAMQRLSTDTVARCHEILSGQTVLVKSRDSRLLAQDKGVRFNRDA